jgi:hypothetical protein
MTCTNNISLFGILQLISDIPYFLSIIDHTLWPFNDMLGILRTKWHKI